MKNFSFFFFFFFFRAGRIIISERVGVAAAAANVTANVFFIGVRRRDGLWLQLLTLTFVPWTDERDPLFSRCSLTIMSGKKYWCWRVDKKISWAGVHPSIHPPLYFFCRGAVVDWAMPRVRDYSSRIIINDLRRLAVGRLARQIRFSRNHANQTPANGGGGRREGEARSWWDFDVERFFFSGWGKAISSFSSRLYRGRSFISYF